MFVSACVVLISVAEQENLPCGSIDLVGDAGGCNSQRGDVIDHVYPPVAPRQGVERRTEEEKEGGVE